MLKGGTEVKVNVAIHRDVHGNVSKIVDRIDEERIQILYGDKYQESQYFTLIVENGSKSDRLNLTMIVQEKEEQIVTYHLCSSRSRRKSMTIEIFP